MARRGDDAESRNLHKAMVRASVSEVQMLLNTLGFRIGDADGVAGPHTRAAISEFQLRDGMQMSGEVTDELIARLKNSARASKAKDTENQ